MDLDSVIVEREVEDELIWITVSKYALFMSYGKVGIDAKSLYEHYQFTALLQKTNSVWALDTYCRQGLDWGRTKYDKAKSLLKDLDLIEEYQEKDEKGQFGKKYIKVRTRKVELEPTRLSEKRQAGLTASGETTTNALTKKINASTRNINSFNEETRAIRKKRKARWVKENPPSLDEMKTYANERKLTHIDIPFLYTYYTDSDWLDKKGNKVFNWKQKLLSLNEINKKNTKNASAEKEPELLTASELRARGLL
jgi:hypothetical protein